MTPRALLSWPSIFALAVAVAGGCDRREETPAQRAPRVVGSSAELFALDDGGATKDERVVRELVGDWTPSAAIETARPHPSRKVKRVEALPPREHARETERKSESEPVVEAKPVSPPAETTPPAREPLPPARPAPPAQEPQAKAETRWQTLPETRSPRADAINASVAIGTIAVGIGSAAVSGDNPSTGARAFAIGSLGVGVVSLSTAFVLYLTEPEPKPGAKTSGVTVTPGVLGLRGTF